MAAFDRLAVHFLLELGDVAPEDDSREVGIAVVLPLDLPLCVLVADQVAAAIALPLDR